MRTKIFWALHKLVLTRHSPVFETMINSEFKEATADKAEIKGFSVDTVRRFLEFIYEKTEVVGRTDDSEFLRLKIVLEDCFYGHQGFDLYDSERANVKEVIYKYKEDSKYGNISHQKIGIPTSTSVQTLKFSCSKMDGDKRKFLSLDKI